MTKCLNQKFLGRTSQRGQTCKPLLAPAILQTLHCQSSRCCKKWHFYRNLGQGQGGCADWPLVKNCDNKLVATIFIMFHFHACLHQLDHQSLLWHDQWSVFILATMMGLVNLESSLIRGGGKVARDKEAARPLLELGSGENISSWESILKMGKQWKNTKDWQTNARNLLAAACRGDLPPSRWDLARAGHYCTGLPDDAFNIFDILRSIHVHTWFLDAQDLSRIQVLSTPTNMCYQIKCCIVLNQVEALDWF